VLLAQITDTHVLEPDEEQFVDNNNMLALAIRSLNAEDPSPDLVLGTGDLTNWARPAQFEVLGELMSELDPPFLPLVGNHDDRALMKQTFPAVPWADADHASWVHELDGIRIVGFDTIDPGQHGAAFDDERKMWLDAALAGDQPTVLAMHHPPFKTGIAWMDAFGYQRVEELNEVIAAHSSKLLRILCGHIHRPMVASVAGVTATVCPSTVHHIVLDLMPNTKPNLIKDPRGYQLHLVDESSVTTHTRYIDTGETGFTPDWV
jgi:Icc protein